MQIYFSLFCLFICITTQVSGQNLIELKNPGFENPVSEAGRTPLDWLNLGSTSETPPDIQPGLFGVMLNAQQGETYVGLVTRETNTWEGIGQQLNGWLKKDSSYTFSLWLARSNNYKSRTSFSQEPVNFTAPTILKIWGYNSKTKKEELLAESQPVSHSKWVKYEFVLKPAFTDCDELDLMAYFAPGFEQKNGNLLIDNCSAIEKIDR
jgi:hypothetical protein